MQPLTIAGLANAADVGVETVRYYQRRGLLQTPERPETGSSGGGVRRYGEEDVRRLRFIRSAQAAVFTLEEIGELLALDATDDRGQARQIAMARVKVLDTKIAELKAARDALSRLAEECGSGAAGPCPILTAFDGEHCSEEHDSGGIAPSP